jgi:hypothetical protein
MGDIDVGETTPFVDVSYFGVTTNFRLSVAGRIGDLIFIFRRHGPCSINIWGGASKWNANLRNN